MGKNLLWHPVQIRMFFDGTKDPEFRFAYHQTSYSFYRNGSEKNMFPGFHSITRISEILQAIDLDLCQKSHYHELQDKSSFLKCIKKKKKCMALQEALKTPSATRDSIVKLFNSLEMEEIESIAKAGSGNHFISMFIKYVGGDFIDRFME